jgi:hypothetical protein
MISIWLVLVTMIFTAPSYAQNIAAHGNSRTKQKTVDSNSKTLEDQNSLWNNSDTYIVGGILLSVIGVGTMIAGALKYDRSCSHEGTEGDSECTSSSRGRRREANNDDARQIGNIGGALTVVGIGIASLGPSIVSDDQAGIRFGGPQVSLVWDF